MSDTTTQAPRRGRWLFLGTIGALFLGVLAMRPAFAGWGGSGHGWCHGSADGDVTAEQVRARMDRMSARVLDKVDATDEQKAEISAILDTLAPDVADLKNEAHDLRTTVHAAFSADDIDAGALQEARADAASLFDRASARMVDAVIEVSAVLTAEQREDLMGRWHR